MRCRERARPHHRHHLLAPLDQAQIMNHVKRFAADRSRAEWEAALESSSLDIATRLEKASESKESGNAAFKSCASLTTLDMKVDGVKVIGGETFKDCSALASFTGRPGLERIMIGAFERCSALAAVTLPHGLTQIDADAFRGTSIAALSLAASPSA